MAEDNGYVKWPVFRWFVGGFCLALVIIGGYIISNDAKRECDKDAVTSKLDGIQKGVDAIRIDMGPYFRQIDVNTKVLERITETKLK